MAAESLHFSFGTLSSWELEAWYEDLQEVLSSDENGGTYGSPLGNEEVRILHLKLGGNVDLPFSTNSTYLSSFLWRKNQKPSPLLTPPLWLGWQRSQDQQRSQAPPKALALQIPVRAPLLRRKKRKTKEYPGNGNGVANLQPGLESNAWRRKNKRMKGK